MEIREPRLADRFDLGCSTVLINGTQALVRLLLEQAARDASAGLNTAGYVSGYRGSPLGAVDFQMANARAELEAARIHFAPALNEDIAATALWGTQQAELRGEGLHDGVFGLWYGKGPGVDRSGDVLRHANFAGTSRFGGVVMALGDDHTGESSTTLHQSEFALMDAYVPVLSPAGVQELIEFGLLGFALSRYSGNWVGLKCVKETIESTAVVTIDDSSNSIVIPELELPVGGLNIRLHDTPRAQEARVIEHRRYAAEAFWRANRIDQRVIGKPGARLGFVSAGKSWLDLVHALQLLDIDENEAERLGITAYKVGMTWPLDRESLTEWTEGLDLVVVVEEKRKLLEFQIREALSGIGNGLRILGRHDKKGREIFPSKYALEPVWIANRIGEILEREGRISDRLNEPIAALRCLETGSRRKDLIQRVPYFCSGCPHNTSTKLPEGSRAYAGIGCHYMVQWMDRETVGFTHMGGEGANWIGESQFSKRGHVFQNMGDGTYNHSGIMAIRAAVAANANMTYKILFNDAVAMTGGQKNDGALSAGRIAHELVAIGLKRVVVVHDGKEQPYRGDFPKGVDFFERSELEGVQRTLRDTKGVTAIVYVQTCAAEKRRRRKRGTFPDIDRRVFINTDVCEGCGDCGVQSNCISIVPVDTPFGTKRSIDQSSCNKDFSCLEGFCPSFVTLEGAVPKSRELVELDIPELPLPGQPPIHGTFNIVVTGVGGTGVVTIGAILAMAGFLDGKGAAMIEMAGLAQKGGAVCVHCRIAERQEDISAIRVSVGEADCLVGGDLVVAASSEFLSLARPGRTGASVNEHEIITGEFTRNPDFRIPGEGLRQRLVSACGEDRTSFLDAVALSRRVLGDSIYSNMVVLGHAWQRGFLPLSLDALVKAIELNGASVKNNKEAFALGRWAALHPDLAEGLVKTAEPKEDASKNDLEVRRAEHLALHTGGSLVDRWRELLDRFSDPELRSAVSEAHFKLLAIKDEYEVARLHLETAAKARAEFDGDFRMSFHLAPPIFNRTGANGRPAKRRFGPWMIVVFRLLARMKRLRGTLLDPFAYSRERRLQREFLSTYEEDMIEVAQSLTGTGNEAALELARLPLEVRGFGPVWEKNWRVAMERREVLLEEFRSGTRKEFAVAAE